jgi:hypothetical protein
MSLSCPALRTVSSTPSIQSARGPQNEEPLCLTDAPRRLTYCFSLRCSIDLPAESRVFGRQRISQSHLRIAPRQNDPQISTQPARLEIDRSGVVGVLEQAAQFSGFRQAGTGHQLRIGLGFGDEIVQGVIKGLTLDAEFAQSGGLMNGTL